MSKYLIYLVNVNGVSLSLFFLTWVLIGYFSCKEMLLLLYVELECSHLANSHMSSTTFLVWEFSGNTV